MTSKELTAEEVSKLAREIARAAMKYEGMDQFAEEDVADYAHGLIGLGHVDDLLEYPEALADRVVGNMCNP